MKSLMLSETRESPGLAEAALREIANRTMKAGARRAGPAPHSPLPPPLHPLLDPIPAALAFIRSRRDWHGCVD
jgi:hypothetical protein